MVKTSQREDHTLIDFTIGREVGLGSLSHSVVSAGLGYARLTSRSMLAVEGIPDWDAPEFGTAKYDGATHHWVDANLVAGRKFEGAGPIVSWDAAMSLVDLDDAGHLDATWAVGTGILFGRQSTDVEGGALSNSYLGRYWANYEGILLDSDTTVVDRHRSKSTTVPTVNLSLGLAYEIDRFKVGAGYRWERYFDAIDAGDQERREFDRTIDGPYFKLSVGFGG